MSALPGVFNIVSQLWSFSLPFGITFGQLVAAVFGLPVLAKCYRRFF